MNDYFFFCKAYIYVFLIFGFVPFYVSKREWKKDAFSLGVLLRKPYSKKKGVILVLVYRSAGSGY